MMLHTLQIPDDPALLPEWLEGQLMGLHLHQVAAELAVLGRPHATSASLHEILGPQRDDVLHLGLRSLSRDQLRQLLRHPEALLELQGLVLEQGGEYWTSVPANDEVRDNSRKAWDRIQGTMREASPPTTQPRSRVSRPWLFAAAGWTACAAAVLIAIFVQGSRVAELEARLTQQAQATETLRQELLAQRSVIPADLPDSEFLVSASADPEDLPDGDPNDLPPVP